MPTLKIFLFLNDSPLAPAIELLNPLPIALIYSPPNSKGCWAWLLKVTAKRTSIRSLNLFIVPLNVEKAEIFS